MTSLGGRRVLVTGAGGFIGSHLVEALVREGAEVTALVRYNARGDWGNLALADPEILDAVEVQLGDVRDPFMMGRAVRGKDQIFHLAALVGIPYSYHAPHSYVETNVGGTLNVLQASLEADVERMIHTSTSEVYGTAEYTPIDEAHPLRGQSPYSASKIGADKLAESYWLSYGLRVSVIRPFNTYGPRQSARAVIPTILTQLAAGGDVLRIGALNPMRDFTFVEDTVAGFLAVAGSEATIGDVTNVGSGVAVTIEAVADLCCEIAGRRPRIETELERVRPDASEVLKLECDFSKATRTAGWEPRNELRDGLARAWRFIQESPERYRPERYAV